MRKFGIDGDLSDDYPMKSLHIGVVVVGFGIFLATIPGLMHLARINAYSLRILWSAIGDEQRLILAGDPPEGHRRATLWQAQDALVQGQPEVVQTLLEADVEKGEPLAVSAYAHTLAAQGRHREAIQYWSRAGDFNSLFSAAQALAEQGRIDEAELAYQAAYQIKPHNTVNRYADFLSAQRGPEAAEAFLRIAIARFPGAIYLPQWLERLGTNLRVQGRLAEAEVVFQQALSAHPDTIYLLIGLGSVYVDQGQQEMAIEQFERAIELYPDQGDGYYYMGLLIAHEERFFEADAWLKEAVRLEPERLGYCLARGNNAWKADDWVLAIEVYQDCSERFPKDGRAFGGLANALYQEGRSAEAQTTIEQALKLPPNPGAPDWTLAGLIYESNGEVERARDAFLRVLELDPQNSIAPAGLERLHNP